MTWFVRFGAGATAGRVAVATQEEAVAEAVALRAQGLRARVGWALDYVE